MTFQIKVRIHGVEKTLNVENVTFQTKADAIRHILTSPGYRPQFVVTDPEAAPVAEELAKELAENPTLPVGAKYDPPKAQDAELQA